MNDLAANLPATVPPPPEPPAALEGGGDVTEFNQMQPFGIPYAEYLCERQQLAIHLLLAGEREAKVAEKIGVCRQTIWRWRNDLHFRSALAIGRRAAFGSAVDRLRALVPEAVDRVEEQLDAGDAMAPFRVLRLAGADRPEGSDPTE